MIKFNKYLVVIIFVILIISCGGTGDLIEGFSESSVESQGPQIPTFYTLDQLDETDVPSEYALFKSEVEQWGIDHHQARVADYNTLDNAYSEVADGNVYYDASAGYYQAAIKLGLSDFLSYGDVARDLYTDLLTSLASDYAISGRRNFNLGYFIDYLRTGNSDSQTAIKGLRDEAVPSDFYIDGRFTFFQFQHEGGVRELSYKLQNLLLYEASENIIDQADAYSNNLRINTAKRLLINHVQALSSFQYTAPEDSVSDHPTAQLNSYGDWKFTQVFMLALAADALIDYVDWVRVRRSVLEEAGYIGLQADDQHIQSYEEALAEIKPVIISIGQLLFEKNIVIARIRLGADGHGASTVAVGAEVTISYTGASGTENYRRIVTAAETTDPLVHDRFEDIDYFHITQPVIVDDGDFTSPSITASVTGGGSLNVAIEQLEDVQNPGGPSRGKLWIEDLGGSSGAYTEAGGLGIGAFRYAVPNYYAPLGGGYVSIPSQAGSGSTRHEVASPDLNMLSLPIMGFLHREGHEGADGRTWKELGDAVFNGGVEAAAWDRTKAYNQQLKNTFKYLEWRQLTPSDWD